MTPRSWARSLYLLHLHLREDPQWHSTMEIEGEFAQPEQTIVALLSAIESLDPQSRNQWAACSRREFDIGYECGDEPWAFNHALTAQSLGRMASLGISLRMTLYPAEQAASEPSEPSLEV